MAGQCLIELLGGLRARCGDGTVTRFRTQRTGALLAYLAYHLDRQHPREELVDLFWPEADLESGRMSLRTSLASLRRQLEPPGTPPGSILAADRARVSLNAATVSTDVLAMESAVAAAEGTGDPSERISLLEQAVALYRGPLLPGIYADWAVRERERMQMRHQAILLKLVTSLEQAGECCPALDYAHRAVTLDPLAEEAHCAMMRLFAATGQSAAVTRQYRELARLLRREMRTEPSAATQQLYARLTSRSDAQVGPAASLVAGNAPRSVPSVDGLPRAAARLPVYLTPFFGREHEQARIIGMLCRDGARLVTITGPGGSGKTRLAVEAARAIADDLDGAVWFVPLADIADPALIPETVARALELPSPPGRAPLEALRDALGYRRSLLLLDNFEQLAEEGSLAVRDLLGHVPTLSVLVTSRQRLEVCGERDFPLSPLPVPDMPGAPEWLAEYASVRLFVDRAQAVRPDFRLTAENAPAVAALCERLEGIPLALELAAAWSQVLTPGRMLARLAARDDLLTSSRRDVAPRHKTLRATFEWSYRLLPPDLQRLLAWLSVFRGGWTLEAADAVCAGLQTPGHGVPCEDTLAQMRALADRSLVLVEEAGDDMRFRMLETLREYAAEQLVEEDRRAAEERQSSWFLQLAEQAEEGMRGLHQAVWVVRMDRDLDNLRAVLERAQRRGDVETGLRMAASLGRYWQASGGGDEGLRWLESLLVEAADAAPALRAKALCELGGLLYCRRLDKTILEVLEESLRIYTELDDTRAMANVLRRLSSAIHDITRDPEAAAPMLHRALALCEGIGDKQGTAESLRSLGSASRDNGEYAAASSYYDRSLSLYREIGDLHGMGSVLADMGYMLQAQEQYDRAEALLQENLDLSRRLGNKVSIGHALWLLGRLAQDRGGYETAGRLLEEGLALARQTGNRQQAVNCLVNLALLASQQGDHPAARRRYAESLAVTREIGNRSGLVLPLRLDGHSALECGETGAARERFRECLSILHGRNAPYSTIDCLEGVAAACRADGQARQAARLYGAAEAAREASSEPTPPFDPAERVCAVEALRAALGDAAFRQAWEEGRALSLEQAVEMALLAG